MLHDRPFCLIFLFGPLRPLTTVFWLLTSEFCPQRRRPRAREAKTPPEQRMAETTKVIVTHFRKEE